MQSCRPAAASHNNFMSIRQSRAKSFSIYLFTVRICQTKRYGRIKINASEAVSLSIDYNSVELQIDYY